MEMITFLKNLFKKNNKSEIMKMKTLEEFLQDIVDAYHTKLAENVGKDWGVSEIPEIDDMKIKEIFTKYFENSVSIDDAKQELENCIDEIIPDAEVDYDAFESYDEAEKTPEYKQHHYNMDVKSVIIYGINGLTNYDEYWVSLHGKRHTNEEAATIATNKVMELCFGWHLQDNGALDENHSFMASALATTMGSKAKDKIPQEVKDKAKELFYEYFYRYLKYVEDLHNYGPWKDYINWLRTNVPVPSTSEWSWEFPDGEVSCDYHPCVRWSSLLRAAGLDDNIISVICPWKTTIYIRSLDNAVIYQTYQKCEYL